MRLGHDTVVALFGRRGDDDETVRADFSGATGSTGWWRTRMAPLALLAVLSTLYGGIAAYWAVTGAPPSFLTPASKRAKLDIPPRPGPESRQTALLRPPGEEPKPEPPATTLPGGEPEIVKPSPASDPALPAVPSGPSAAPQLALLPPAKASPLPPAPVPDLVRMTSGGPLPVIAPDGRAPWQTYARPFTDAAGRTRLAVIVSGLGLGKAVTEAAISRLPADVTLSFSPYAKDVTVWLKKARDAGHEVMLDLPLEAARFPERDPGPLALLQSLSDAKVKERWEAVLTKGAGYVGVLAAAGSPMIRSDRFKPVIEDMRSRGLLFVGDASGLPEDVKQQPAFAPVALTVDGQFRAAIDARFDLAATQARTRGKAAVVVPALPVTIEQLSRWLGRIDKGTVLAPVSAVATPPVAMSLVKETK
jgi:polysaccharide deacetylase 2 family uncharacterized protein YibQ